jgi:hypothetical protein
MVFDPDTSALLGFRTVQADASGHVQSDAGGTYEIEVRHSLR